nr:Putative ribonuclease H protein [Ipomoea batatas]
MHSLPAYHLPVDDLGSIRLPIFEYKETLVMWSRVADEDLSVLEDGDGVAEYEIDCAVDLALVEELAFGLCQKGVLSVDPYTRWIHSNGGSAVHIFNGILPSFILWELWTAYNSSIFDGVRVTRLQLVKSIKRHLFHMSIARPPVFLKSTDSLLLSEGLIAAFAPKKRSIIPWIKWLRPPSGCLKLNTDAAFTILGSAGRACLRNSSGSLIAALVFPIDASSALEVETFALDFSLRWCDLTAKWP